MEMLMIFFVKKKHKFNFSFWFIITEKPGALKHLENLIIISR